MTIQINLTDAQMAQLLTPPDGVDAGIYLAHVSGVFRLRDVSVAKPDAPRNPGRPIKYGHPAYLEAEFRQIRDYLLQGIAENPWMYENKAGKPARGLAKEHPDDATVFVLDNGVELYFSDPFTFPEGLIEPPPYPPVIVGGKE